MVRWHYTCVKMKCKFEQTLKNLNYSHIVFLENNTIKNGNFLTETMQISGNLFDNVLVTKTDHLCVVFVY